MTHFAQGVKSRRVTQQAFGRALDAIASSMPEEAAAIREYVREVNEEAAFWRVRFRGLQAEIEAKQ